MDSNDSFPSVEDQSGRRDALFARLTEAGTGMLEVFSIFLGERLGFYEALSAGGPATSHELAGRTGTHERYAREWLEQQAVAGFLMVDSPEEDAARRRFALPAAHREVLADAENLFYWGAQARCLVGLVSPVGAVQHAFRTGGGVPYAAYGADLREGLADSGRVMYRELMGSAWLPAMPDVHARLLADPPAAVADVGCGAGWSSLAIARAYPKARVDGFDLDADSVALACRNVDAAGMAAQVTITCRDAGDPALSGRYDLVTAFICLHDMARPVDVLRAMRGLAGADGAVLIADPHVGERFLGAENDRDVERFMYGASILHCLPVGMAEQPSAGTGTVMRPDVLRDYAREAGFTAVEQLPIDDPYTAFYRLHR